MRLVSYSLNTPAAAVHVGVELGNTILNVYSALQHYGVEVEVPASHFTMRNFLELGGAAMDKVKNAVSEGVGTRVLKSDITLKAPVTNPEKVICVGMNYVDHCTEQNYPIPTEPVIFNKFPSCICGPGDDLPLIDGQTEELDFEVEMVIVVGKEGKNIDHKEAMNFVAGYTVAHDVSARDWQLKKNGGQWLMGKTFDNYAPIGPAIVTCEELGDAHKLGIRCSLNGKPVQSSNTDQLIFKTEHLVEWISKYITLKPGDLILTGTPPGVGCFRKPPLFLKDGDRVTCEIDGIGAITNTVKKTTAQPNENRPTKKQKTTDHEEKAAETQTECIVTYWGNRGMCEPVRLTLAATGVPFKSVHMKEPEELRQLRQSKKLPYGQVPLVEIDGLCLVQSVATMMYLARRGGVYPSSIKEQYQVDLVVAAAQDARKPLVGFPFVPAQKREPTEWRKKINDARYFKKWDTTLQENKGSYLVGGKISLADIAVFEVLDFADFVVGTEIFQEIMSSYPDLMELYKNIGKTGRVAEYKKERAIMFTHDLDQYAKDVRHTIDNA